MPTFTLEIQTGEVIQVVKLLEASYRDPTALMTDILLLMIRSTQLTFEQQGRPEKWADLSPATIAQRLRKIQKSTRRKILPDVRKDSRKVVKADKSERARKLAVYKKLFKRSDKYYAAVGSIQILRNKGLLFQSVGGNAAGAFEAAGGFGEADKFTATLGTNRPGADALQGGVPEHNLPARPFLLLQPQDETDAADIGIQFMLRTGPYAA